MFVGGPSVSSRRILRASRKMSGIFLYGFLETRAQLFSERRYEGLSHDGKVLAGNAANFYASFSPLLPCFDRVGCHYVIFWPGLAHILLRLIRTEEDDSPRIFGACIALGHLSVGLEVIEELAEVSQRHVRGYELLFFCIGPDPPKLFHRRPRKDLIP